MKANPASSIVPSGSKPHAGRYSAHATCASPPQRPPIVRLKQPSWLGQAGQLGCFVLDCLHRSQYQLPGGISESP
eukprot:scaffold128693_cov68-Phaeocystis_antarctica.AAC.11